MATTLEIVRGISQVMANTHDGALDDNDEPVKVGLKREEGNPINDSRIMDGFRVSFPGSINNKTLSRGLCIHYHAEIKLKDVHDKNFESDIGQMFKTIAKFLKKEYKKITGNSLSLKPNGEMEALVQNTSRVRTWVQAKQHYTIGGVNIDPIHDESKDSVDAKFKEFLGQGGWGKQEKNDKRKKPTEGQPIHVGGGKIMSRKNIHSPLKAE